MKVEIWSDVMCPFCYIGKRKFEAALAQFAAKNLVEVEWKSFQLQPDLKTDATKNTVEHLAETKGWPLLYAQQMTQQVTDMAAEVGLHYDLDKAVVANSLDAHRLSHLAKKYGVQDALEEALFKAYFTDGKNTADHAVLKQLAMSAGIPEAAIEQVLSTNAYTNEVRQDIADAQRIGVRGVPFFVMGHKYAVSGAQPVETFAETLNIAWNEWSQQHKTTDITTAGKGDSCSPEEGCS